MALAHFPVLLSAINLGKKGCKTKEREGMTHLCDPLAAAAQNSGQAFGVDAASHTQIQHTKTAVLCDSPET